MEIHSTVFNVTGECVKKRKREKKDKKRKDKKDKKHGKKHRRGREAEQDRQEGAPVLSSDSEASSPKLDGSRDGAKERKDDELRDLSFSSKEDASSRALVESSALDFVSGSSPPLMESSALDVFGADSSASSKRKTDHTLSTENMVPQSTHDRNTTLLLFYQYVEPAWSASKYTAAKQDLAGIALKAGVTGRMRVAREGLNCTLTGTAQAILQFCSRLRQWDPIFLNTEFKLTHDLPDKQLFRELKLIPVLELVHYGLEGDKAPPICKYQGTHLEPKDYHAKLAEDETVVIDVRNHYEAAIGRFDAPNSKWLDPKMRKSTSFPVWLDDPNTKKELANKQVLMVSIES
jgi:hypothetical protein